MFPTQNRPRRRTTRPPVPPRRPRYADVVASLALFVALGGTAAAAVTLDTDSVGSPQIRKDAVRSPEIAADAVRSSEIRSGAVRSSEIRDAGIKTADISTGARTELRGALKFVKDDNDGFLSVPRCDGTDLSACPNHLKLALASVPAPGRQGNPAPTTPGGSTPGPQVPEAGRNWLIQAKMHIFVRKGSSFIGDRCGLVNASDPAEAVLDEVFVGPNQGIETETIALSAIVRKRLRNPNVALRCSRQDGDRVEPTNVKLTALEVGAVTGP